MKLGNKWIGSHVAQNIFKRYALECKPTAKRFIKSTTEAMAARKSHHGLIGLTFLKLLGEDILELLVEIAQKDVRTAGAEAPISEIIIKRYLETLKHPRPINWRVDVWTEARAESFEEMADAMIENHSRLAQIYGTDRTPLSRQRRLFLKAIRDEHNDRF